MKRVYFLYAICIFISILAIKLFLLTPQGGLIMIAGFAIFVPAALIMLPMIFIKRHFLIRAFPAHIQNGYKLAIQLSLSSFPIMMLYILFLFFIANELFAKTQHIPATLFGVQQTYLVIGFEIWVMLLFVALLSKLIEYRVLSHFIISIGDHQGRKALWFANLVSYSLATVLFFVFQIMIYYQWPHFLFKML